MRLVPRTLLASLQLTCGGLLGLYAWYNLSSIYWQKDLELPVDSRLLLVAEVGAGILVIGFVFVLSSRLVPKGRFELLHLSWLASAVGLPAVNAISALVFTALGGESSIYFITENGMSILAADSLFLLIAGSIVGLVIGGFTLLLSLTTSSRLP